MLQISPEERVPFIGIIDPGLRTLPTVIIPLFIHLSGEVRNSKPCNEASITPLPRSTESLVGHDPFEVALRGSKLSGNPSKSIPPSKHAKSVTSCVV